MITLEEQDRIRDLCQKDIPVNIDGSGCDSGDPMDLTLAEISQAINYWRDEAFDVQQRLEAIYGAMSEDHNSDFRMHIVYDNYHDGVVILNGDKEKLAECYSMDLRPREQLLAVLDSLVEQGYHKKYKNDE